MDDVKKYVDFSYLVGMAMITWVFMQVFDSIWLMWRRLPNPAMIADVRLSTAVGILVGVGLTAYLRLNPRIYKVVTECGVELKKTIWPGWKETKSNTVVVIAVSLIMGFILWFFDLVWKNLTDIIYG